MKALFALFIVLFTVASIGSHQVESNGVRVLQENELENLPVEFKQTADLSDDEQELYVACEAYYPYQVRNVVRVSRERQAMRIEKGHAPLPQSSDELRQRGGCEDLIKVYVSKGFTVGAILGIVFSR